MYLLFFCTDIYTIEFQKKKKKGLSHPHMLFFLHPSNKYSIAKDIDKIIAEIPNPHKQKDL